MKFPTLIGLLFISALLYIGCTNEKAADIVPSPTKIIADSISYRKHVSMIILRRCSEGADKNPSCHFPPDLGNADLSTYEALTSSYSAKRMMDAVNQNGNAIAMPYNNPKIPQAEIDTLQAWVDKGRLNN